MRRTSFTSLGSVVVSTLVFGACNATSRLEDARIQKAKVQISTVKMAAELQYMKTGKWPASLADVDLSRRDDPWGRPFHYSVAGSNSEPVIFSAGPDGVDGNADDVREEIR